MPFGLMNAPASFQRCMQNTLSQQPEFSSIYIDDVLIYSSSWKEDLEHIRGVLEALRETGGGGGGGGGVYYTWNHLNIFFEHNL